MMRNSICRVAVVLGWLCLAAGGAETVTAGDAEMDTETVAAAEVRVICRPVPGNEQQTQQRRGSDESHWQMLVMAKTAKEKLPAVTPQITCDDAVKVTAVFPEKADVGPDGFTLFYVTLAGKAVPENTAVSVSLPDGASPETRIRLTSAVDLLQIPWESVHAGENVWLADEPQIPGDTAVWQAQPMPKLWPRLGVTWLRTRFFAPERWRGNPITLTISAVDDADVTYVNGQRIGQTKGWDTPRRYAVPENLLKYGEMNEILIAAENANAGGGIKEGPVRIGPESFDAAENLRLFPKPAAEKEAARQKPRAQALPLPLRAMAVRDGVLEYVDGGEVALWGVNYYPQSWHEYRLLKEQGVDFKAAIRADLDDLLEAGDNNAGGNDPARINAIRIHIFDSEICDSEGRLMHNEHLDLLDYLVGECNRRGVYLWLTPIAWWGSPQGVAGSFSENVPMQAMTLCRETWPAQQRYITALLEHENPYTGRRLADEPCLALLEIINEPLYWTLDEVRDPRSTQYGRAWRKDGGDPNVAFRERILREWRKTLPGPQWETDESWDFFMYAQIREYVNTMYETIRVTGARQPVAYSASGFNTLNPAYQAVADSRCEAVTLVFYTGLQQKPVADAANQLPRTADGELPAILKHKARLVYGFDASDTLRQIDNYPAIARHFRNLGVQVACQFQYDSRFNAGHNQAWPTHYLNAVHTPERFASFLIAGETFRRLPRGTQYVPADPDAWVFPPTAVSYSRNAAVLCGDTLYMQARPTEWMPLSPPKSPARMIAVGPTPYYEYTGTGMADLRIDGDTATLRLGPDVVRLRHDTLRGTPDAPLTRLENGRHTFRLKLPGWEKSGAMEVEAGKTYRWEK